MAKIFTKKPLSLIVILIILSTLAWGVYEWSAPSNHQSQLKEAKEKYATLQDSIQNLDYQIREAHEVQIIQLQKDRLTLFQKQIESTRKSITLLSKSKKSLAFIPFDLSASLSKNPLIQILLWIALALCVFVTILFFMIKKRKNMTSKAKVKAKPITMDQVRPPTAQEAGQNQLEDLLARLQAGGPVAKVSQRPKKSTQVASHPINSPTVIAESDLNEITPAAEVIIPNQSSDSTIEKVAESHFQTGPEVSANFNPAPAPKFDDKPKEEEIFPSSLNRLDQEDREKSDVLKLARRGYTSSEIARRLKLSQDQVEFIIRLEREKG